MAKLGAERIASLRPAGRRRRARSTTGRTADGRADRRAADDPGRRAVPVRDRRRSGPDRGQRRGDDRGLARALPPRPSAGDGRVVRPAAHRGGGDGTATTGAFDEIFHPIAERLLARCDACLRIGGPSEGADRMVATARGLGKARLPRHRGGPVSDARGLHQVRDDDRRGRPRACRPAGLLRRGRAAEHRGQPRPADGRPGSRARLRGRRLRGPAGAAAAVDRRPDDRDRRDRGRQHARAVRLLPPARARSTSASSAPRRSTGSATSTRPSSAPYDHPTTRLPGSGGACEIAINARQVFVIMRQSTRSFVETIDFRTSPGNLGGADRGRADPARGWLARARTERRRHRSRHLPLRRRRRDAARFAPPGRDGRGGPRTRSAGRSRSPPTSARHRHRPTVSCG